MTLCYTCHRHSLFQTIIKWHHHHYWVLNFSCYNSSELNSSCSLLSGLCHKKLYIWCGSINHDKINSQNWPNTLWLKWITLPTEIDKPRDWTQTTWHLYDPLNGTLWPDYDFLITVSHPWIQPSPGETNVTSCSQFHDLLDGPIKDLARTYDMPFLSAIVVLSESFECWVTGLSTSLLCDLLQLHTKQNLKKKTGPVNRNCQEIKTVSAVLCTVIYPAASEWILIYNVILNTPGMRQKPKVKLVSAAH